MSLTKADMAEMLFDELGLNKREAKEIVEQFFVGLDFCKSIAQDICDLLRSHQVCEANRGKKFRTYFVARVRLVELGEQRRPAGRGYRVDLAVGLAVLRNAFAADELVGRE